MSSPFQKSFSAKSPITTSPLNGAYTEAKDGMVTVSYDDIHKDFQQGIADNVSKAYAKKTNPCDDPKTVQYTEDSVLKKCPKKTSPSTTNSNSTFTMPADLKALAGKGTESNTPSSPGIYDVLAGLAEPIQNKAVKDIKKALDPNKNN